MPTDHVLALDAGTSGARCLIARPGVGTVAVARREWGYHTPPEIAPFGRTFDPDAFWSILCDVTKEALAQAELSGADIAAVGITSQRFALLVIDREGRTIYAGPNSDVRAFAEGLAIDARLAERVYDTTGKLPSLLLAPARLQWLQKHRAADFERAAAVLSLGDWVAYRLTGEVRAERTLAGDNGLLDITTAAHAKGLLGELAVPASLLPPLIASGTVVGKLTRGSARGMGLAASTPVVIVGGDSQCGLLGMGVFEPGQVGIVAGWSCPLQQVSGEPKIDPRRRTWTCLHVLPERWVVESSAANAGQVWRWWCETLLGKTDAALAEGAALAALAQPASRILASFGPLAMNAKAMGPHLGGLLLTTPVPTDAVGRAELLRAVLENIAFALRANLDQAEEVSGLRVTRIALGGGLTRSPLFPRLVADVLGRPVEVGQEFDVTARGAAVLTARALGIDETALAVATECVEPDAAAAERYQGPYRRWRTLTEALDATMKELP